MPREIQKMVFAVLIFSEGFDLDRGWAEGFSLDSLYRPFHQCHSSGSGLRSSFTLILIQIDVARIHLKKGNGWKKLYFFKKCSSFLSCKDVVHIVVFFAYLLLSYSKFEWAENAVVQDCTKKLRGKQIICTTKWFLWKLNSLSHLYLN